MTLLSPGHSPPHVTMAPRTSVGLKWSVGRGPDTTRKNKLDETSISTTNTSKYTNRSQQKTADNQQIKAMRRWYITTKQLFYQRTEAAERPGQLCTGVHAVGFREHWSTRIANHRTHLRGHPRSAGRRELTTSFGPTKNSYLLREGDAETKRRNASQLRRDSRPPEGPVHGITYSFKKGGSSDTDGKWVTPTSQEVPL